MTKIKVTQVRSTIGCPSKHRLVMKGLGLRRMHHSVMLRDTPAIRGMIRRVQHLVDVQVHAGEADLFGLRHRD